MQNKPKNKKAVSGNRSGIKALFYSKKAGIATIAVLSAVIVALIVLLILDGTGILYGFDKGNNVSIPSPSCSDTTVYSEEGGIYEYMILDDGSIMISGCTADRSITALTIPSEINGLKVTALGNSSFFMMTWISSVTVPEGVTYIGSEAFAYCGVSTVSLPSSLMYIQNNAFLSCLYLSTVYYSGSTENWDNILIGIGNTNLQRNIITAELV